MNSDGINNAVDSLIAQTKVGRDDAFDEIALRYAPLIESMVHKFAFSDDVDELEQVALIALYQAACTYDSDSGGVSFGLYAKICIRNSLISYRRSEIKSEHVNSDSEDVENNFRESCDPVVDCINKESFMKLDRFVRSHLSEYEYSVYRFYIEGYKIKEIAAHLSKTEKSVEGAIMRLKMKLRNNFSKYDL